MSILLGLGVFVISVITDIVWARYTQHVADGAKMQAAAFAALIAVVGAFGWFAYHESLWYTIPMATGAAVGTYIGTKKSSGTCGDSSRAVHSATPGQGLMP